MSSSFNLLIDIGNSRIKWLFQPADVAFDISVKTESFNHHDAQWLDSLKTIWLQHVAKPPSVCLISNVAGSSTLESVKTLLAQLYPNTIIQSIEPHAKCGSLSLAYNEPKQMGSDRYAQLLGAQYLYANSAHIIVSAGTAITIDGVLASGQHIGGAIVPSIHLMRASLHQQTARLPLDGGQFSPYTAPNNTADALAAGARLATNGAITTFIANYMIEPPTQLIICGGGASAIASDLSKYANDRKISIEIVPSLCLLGLWRFSQTISTNALEQPTADATKH